MSLPHALQWEEGQLRCCTRNAPSTEGRRHHQSFKWYHPKKIKAAETKINPPETSFLLYHRNTTDHWINMEEQCYPIHLRFNVPIYLRKSQGQYEVNHLNRAEDHGNSYRKLEQTINNPERNPFVLFAIILCVSLMIKGVDTLVKSCKRYKIWLRS